MKKRLKIGIIIALFVGIIAYIINAYDSAIFNDGYTAEEETPKQKDQDTFNPIKGNANISWVDFIQIKGKSFLGIRNAIITDPKNVREEIGSVKFNVAENVTNPNYRIQDGDAGFLEKGTKIFALEGYPQHTIVAVKDDKAMNGYSLYYESDNYKNYIWYYKSVPKDKAKKIEIYFLNDNLKRTLTKQILGETDVKQFLILLDRGESRPSFSPLRSIGDSKRYELYLYTDEVYAYHYNLFFDGTNYYWSPKDISVLPNEISKYLKGD